MRQPYVFAKRNISSADNGGDYLVVALAEGLQHRVVHVVVDENNLLMRCTYQVGHEGVGVKHLPVVEHALNIFLITCLLPSWRTTEISSEVALDSISPSA